MSARSERMVLEKVIRPRDPEALALQIKQLAQEEAVEKIVFDRNQNYLVITRQLNEGDEESSLELMLFNRVRSAPMDEFQPTKEEATATQQLLAMWRLIESEGFYVSYILAGTRAAFEKWVGVRFPRMKPVSIFGTAVTFTAQLPADVIVVCGTGEKDAPPTDVQFSLKSVMG